MPIIILLILVSLALGVSFLAAFIWAVRAGQFEDTQTPAFRILPEDEPAATPVTGSGAGPIKTI